jgi:6-phosphogluconolactonase
MIYVGTYTEQNSKGIYGYQLNTETGALDMIGLLAIQGNPSYVVVNHEKTRLYSVSEYHEEVETRSARVCAYEILEDGRLVFLNQVACPGKDPCHLTLQENHHLLYVANYSDGSLSVYDVLEDGRIGELQQHLKYQGVGVHPKRQEGSHIHFVQVEPKKNLVAVVDLGLDQIYFYKPQFQTEGFYLQEVESLRIQVPKGSGPRHLAFGETQSQENLTYIVHELSSEVSVYRKELLLQVISTLPEDYHGDNTCSAIKLEEKKGILYVANRGHDSVAIFETDKETGMFSLKNIVASGGRNPRDLCLDDSKKWMLVANQDSDSIAIFRVCENGDLKLKELRHEISMPVCICCVNN